MSTPTASAATADETDRPDTVLDPRIRRTRRDLKRALEALLGRMTPADITIRDIAAEAGVAYTTFFRHYESRDVLLGDLVDDAVAGLLGQAWSALQAGDTYAACLALCRHVHANLPLWAALLPGEAGVAVKAAMTRRTLDRADSWPPVASWLPRDSGAALLVGMVVEFLSWWLQNQADDPPERMAAILDNLLVSPLIHGVELAGSEAGRG
jgi:AcrR family transcriptional regulator